MPVSAGSDGALAPPAAHNPGFVNFHTLATSSTHTTRPCSTPERARALAAAITSDDILEAAKEHATRPWFKRVDKGLFHFGGGTGQAGPGANETRAAIARVAERQAKEARARAEALVGAGVAGS